jgi:glycosyltransferase involved in cell wall biosynthesis
LTAISNFLLHRAESMGYLDKRSLIPNGVNVELFSKIFSTKEIDNMKIKLGKKTNDIFLVTSSRLVKKNAVDDIISALTFLPENFSLIIIGKGDEGYNLQKQAENLGLTSRIKFVGFIPYTDIPEYFSACDIFVRPSRSEGFGNSFIEAMASHLPVIATPVGGIPDFIDDKETGVFCAPDNPKSIVEAVNLLVTDNSLREHIIIKAFDRVKERYSWNHIAKDMKEEVFDKLLE